MLETLRSILLMTSYTYNLHTKVAYILKLMRPVRSNQMKTTTETTLNATNC